MDTNEEKRRPRRLAAKKANVFFAQDTSDWYENRALAKALAESLKEACENIDNCLDSGDSDSTVSNMTKTRKSQRTNGNTTRKKTTTTTTINGNVDSKKHFDDDIDDEEVCVNGGGMQNGVHKAKKSLTRKSIHNNNKSGTVNGKKKRQPTTSTSTASAGATTANAQSTDTAKDTNNNSGAAADSNNNNCMRKIDARIKAIIASQRRFIPFVENDSSDTDPSKSMKTDAGEGGSGAKRIHATNTTLDDEIPDDFSLFPDKVINAHDFVTFLTNTTFQELQNKTYVHFPRLYSFREVFPKGGPRAKKSTTSESSSTDLLASDIKSLRLYSSDYKPNGSVKIETDSKCKVDEESANGDDVSMSTDDTSEIESTYSHELSTNLSSISDRDSIDCANDDMEPHCSNHISRKFFAGPSSSKLNGHSAMKKHSRASLSNSIKNLFDSKRQGSSAAFEDEKFEKEITNGCSKEAIEHKPVRVTRKKADEQVETTNNIKKETTESQVNKKDLAESKKQTNKSVEETHKRALQYEENMRKSISEIERKYRLRNDQQDQSDCESIQKKLSTDSTDDSSVTMHSDSSMSSWNEEDLPRAVGSLQRIKRLRTQALKKNAPNNSSNRCANRVPSTFDHIQTRSSLRKTRNRKQLHQQRNKDALFQQYDGKRKAKFSTRGRRKRLPVVLPEVKSSNSCDSSGSIAEPNHVEPDSSVRSSRPRRNTIRPAKYRNHPWPVEDVKSNVVPNGIQASPSPKPRKRGRRKADPADVCQISTKRSKLYFQIRSILYSSGRGRKKNSEKKETEKAKTKVSTTNGMDYRKYLKQNTALPESITKRVVKSDGIATELALKECRNEEESKYLTWEFNQWFRKQNSLNESEVHCTRDLVDDDDLVVRALLDFKHCGPFVAKYDNYVIVGIEGYKQFWRDWISLYETPADSIVPDCPTVDVEFSSSLNLKTMIQWENIDSNPIELDNLDSILMKLEMDQHSEDSEIKDIVEDIVRRSVEIYENESNCTITEESKDCLYRPLVQQSPINHYSRKKIDPLNLMDTIGEFLLQDKVDLPKTNHLNSCSH